MKNLKQLFRKRPAGVFVGRSRTRDIAFTYQTPGGIPGRVTRSVPAPVVTSAVNDGTNPVAFYGLACVDTTTNTNRGVLSTDASATIAGFAVQPFPVQAASATNYGAVSIGNPSNLSPNPGALIAVPSGVMDVLRSGFMSVYCNGAQTATKSIPVNIWIAATSGNHIQGGCEVTPSASVASVAGANTGNGTLGALSTTPASAKPGAYVVTFTAATAFNVVDPTGRQLNTGKTGVAYSDAGVNFTITAGGTAFVAGDSFTVTVTFQTLTLDSKSYFNGPGDASGVVELAFNL